MQDHHIFMKSVVKDFGDMVSAIGVDVGDAANRVKLYTDQNIARLEGQAVHLGGHLKAYSSRQRAALLEIAQHLERNGYSEKAVTSARAAYSALQQEMRNGLLGIDEFGNKLGAPELLTNTFSKFGQTRAEATAVIEKFFANSSWRIHLEAAAPIGQMGTTAIAFGARVATSATVGFLSELLRADDLNVGEDDLMREINRQWEEHLDLVEKTPRPPSEGAQQAQRDAAASRPRPPSEGAQQAQADARARNAATASYAKPEWGLDSPSERRTTSGGTGSTKASGSVSSVSERSSGGLSPTERDKRNGNSGSNSGSGSKDPKSTNASKAAASSGGSKSSSSKSYSGWDSSGGTKGNNGRMGRVPVFLDLDGNGLTISDTSTSNLFLDIGGDGYKYRTAWVGAGDGVLMIDVDGDGKISNRKEVVFTDWDPSSETDMQALRQVFDTNGNGLLDAGDGRWSEFKIMLTNADGTISQKTLAEFGIQSINLAVDETKIAVDGGSWIDGQTTFTRTDGTTGLAATVTVAVDTNGYVVTESQSTDASGNKTVVNRAVDKDGQLVSETMRVTSANGLSITSRFDDDGDGVLDRILTDVTVVNANGSRTQNETMRDGGGILTWAKTTQTSADGKTITIDRDERGGGYPTERETRVTAANNSLTITISQLAQNGSVISQVSNVLGSDRLTRTVNIDADGNSTFERRSEHQTIRNGDGSRIERDSVLSGTGTLLSRTEVAIAANNLSRIETSDIDGDGTTDFTMSATTSRNGAGDTTAVEASSARNGAIFGRVTTTTSQNGLSKSVLADLNGDGTTDRESTDVTVLAADQSKSRTQETKSTTGVLLSRSVEQRAADGLVGSISTDADGDGANDLVVAVTKDASGVVTETATATSADGSLVSRSVKTTSANGMTTTTQVDRFGRNVVDQVVSDIVTRNADGSATQTVETRSENQTLITRTMEQTSANGLSVISTVDVTGDGVTDQSTSSVKTLNADGSQSFVDEERSGTGVLLSRETTSISSDRRTISVAQDTDGSGQSDLTELTTIGVDGAQTVEMRELSNSGALLSRSVVTTSANRLNVTQTIDADGDGDTDSVNTDVTSLPSDGRTIRTRGTSSQNGTLLRREVTTTSANGIGQSVEVDINGDNVIDQTVTSMTLIEADGSRAVSDVRKHGTATIATKTVRTSANGLVADATEDLDGNGTADRRQQSIKTLVADGSVIEETSFRAGNNALISRVTKTTSANGMSVVTLVDENGDAATDRRIEETLSAAGVKTSVQTEFGASNVVLSRATTTVERGGLGLSQAFDKNGDGTTDLTRTSSTTIAANGTKTTVSSEYQGTSTLTERAITTESANGLSKSVVFVDGSLNTLRGIQDTQEIFQDGTTRATRLITKADGSTESRTVVDTTANKRTVTTTKDVDGDGVLDKKVVSQQLDDGSSVVNQIDFMPDGQNTGRQTTVQTSANGLSVTYLYDTDSRGGPELQTSIVTVLNADGGKTTTTDYLSRTYGSGSTQVWRLTGKEIENSNGTGTFRSLEWDDNGSGDIDRSETVQIDNPVDGTEIVTRRQFERGRAIQVIQETTSANGLTKVTSLDSQGSGIFDQTKTDTTTIAADGSKVRVVSTVSNSGAVLSVMTETTSADGKTKTVNQSSGLNGTQPLQTTTIYRVLADGSTVETASTTNTSGVLVERLTTTVSDNGALKTIERDADGNGQIDQRETVRKTIDGRLETIVSSYRGGSLSGQVRTVVSADGLLQITDIDKNGDGVVDVRRTTRTTDFVSGGDETFRTELDLKTGLVRSTTRSRRSADGTFSLEETDIDNDGIIDQTVTESVLASGTTVRKIVNSQAARNSGQMRSGEIYWNDKVPASIETTISADGLTKTTYSDVDGDGRYEVSMKTLTRLDGSVITNVTETNADGSVKAQGKLETSHDGRVQTLYKDLISGNQYRLVERSNIRSDASVVKIISEYSANGSLEKTTDLETDSLGSIVLKTVKDAQGRLIEQQVKLADGKSQLTTYVPETGATLTIAAIDEFNIRRQTTLYDARQAETWQRVEITHNASGDKTLEVQFLDNAARVNVVTFSNGQETSGYGQLHYSSGQTTGTSNSEYLLGGAGSDTLVGGDGHDVLDVGAGTAGSWQIMRGGADDDIYVYKRMSGLVLIDASAEASSGGVDKIVFSDLNLSDLTIDTFNYGSSNSNGLALRMSWSAGGATGEIRLANMGANIEQFEFADGSVLSQINGSNRQLFGTAAANFLKGTSGNDTIFGQGGNDTISGGDGGDSLLGGDGNDTLIGGAGIDWMMGGAGADRFIFNEGFGYDAIEDFSVLGGDVIEFGTNDLRSFNEIMALTQDTAEGAIIVRSPTSSLLLKGVSKSSLRPENFNLRPAPTVTVADIKVMEGSGIKGKGDGFLHTQGNQIVDANGNPFKIAGINWFGLESDDLVPHGLYDRSWQSMMDQMKSLGFNTIRLPFASETLLSTSRPVGGDNGGINLFLNQDFLVSGAYDYRIPLAEQQAITSLEIMDKIIDYAGKIGLRIILDHHRSDTGVSASENGLWYNETFTESQWVADWQMLAQRYAGNPTVIGADLHNEPHGKTAEGGATWGDGTATDWRAAAERAGNAIGSVNKDWLVFVEGIEEYNGQSYWWGGNLAGAAEHPVRLDVPNKLVYSAHDYPNSVFAQSWFSSPDYPNNLIEKFRSMWGYLHENNIAPVWLGELGSDLQDPKDLQWLTKITQYIGGDYNGDGVSDLTSGQSGIGWTWWSWNPDSGDTGGILEDDWRTVDQAKLSHLLPLLSPQNGVLDGGTTVTITVSLSSAATETITMNYETVPVGSAVRGGDFQHAAGTLTFLPGEQTKTVSTTIYRDNLAEADEVFSLVISNVTNAVIAKGTGVVTIANDDFQALAGTAVVTDDWGSGFIGRIDLKNNGVTLIDDGWTYEFELPYLIEEIWDAEIVAHSGNTYVVRNLSWNSTLQPNQQTSFGFKASPGNADAGLIRQSGNINRVVGTAGTDVLAGVNGQNSLHGEGGNDVLDGGAVADLLSGGEGSDQLYGHAGADRLYGDAGDDLLDGGAGADQLFGGLGFDTANYAYSAQAIVANLATKKGQGGEAQGDQYISVEAVVGSAFDDQLIGDDANNSFRGGLGADVVDGGAGNDYVDFSDKAASVVLTLNGSSNSTAYVNGVAEDIIRNIEAIIGGSANDQLTGDSADNVLKGGGGNDTLVGGAGSDLLHGGGGADVIDGGSGADTADLSDKTGALNLTLNGATDSTVYVDGVAEDVVRNIENVISGSGDDIIVGDAGSNVINGGAGNDKLFGHGGSDLLQGGAGDDELYGESANDVLEGGSGNDKLFGNGGSDIFDGGEGNDELFGSSGADLLKGGAGADVLYGNGGLDQFYGGAGDDQIYGGTAVDLIDGGDGNDLIYGGDANDTILAGAGNDEVDGGLGNDQLTGGAGADRFMFRTTLDGSQNVDLITDFDVAVDQFWLDRSVFSGLSQGSLSSASFVIGTDAVTAAQRIIFDSSTGNLFYDADGSGGANKVQFARIGEGAALSATNVVAF